MRNGWTQGQYGIYRAIFGGYLFVHFARLVAWAPELFSRVGVIRNPWDSPLAVLFPNILTFCDSSLGAMLVVAAAAGASLLFALGWWDRAAALIVWYLGTCLFDRNPLIANPALPYVGWLLLAHVCLPATPRPRSVSSGGENRWPRQPEIYAIAWILLAAGYSYSGLSKLGSQSWLDGSAVARVVASPLARPGELNRFLLLLPPEFLKCATWAILAMEIGFGPLSLFRRARPLIWSTMLTVHLALLFLVAFGDLTVGMLMIHLFTFDPGWIPATHPKATESLFFDGKCGLCHWAVRLVMTEDIGKAKFRFAPLGDDVFDALISAAQRSHLPDSLVVLTAEGRVLTLSAAVIHILGRLGGMWRCVAFLIRLVPRAFADTAYRFVAGNRFRFFRIPTSVCPLIPADLRVRGDGCVAEPQ